MRRAVTIVEVIVVISIIGMLAALLFPAIQAARNARNRTSSSQPRTVEKVEGVNMQAQEFEFRDHQYIRFYDTFRGDVNVVDSPDCECGRRYHDPNR